MSDELDRLSLEAYRALGELGWRLPKTEDEVKAAENSLEVASPEFFRGFEKLPSADEILEGIERGDDENVLRERERNHHRDEPARPDLEERNRDRER